MKRIDSVFIGRDPELLDIMIDFYAPNAKKLIDVCCNKRKMWKNTRWGEKVIGYDIDADLNPNIVTSWDDLPDPDSSVDLLFYDPPHLPKAAATEKSHNGYKKKLWIKF